MLKVKRNKKIIIVLGLESKTSLGVIRSLIKKKYSVIGIDQNYGTKYAKYSKYLYKYFLIEKFDYDSILKIIQKISIPYKTYIIPTEDRHLRLFDKYSKYLDELNIIYPSSDFKFSELGNKEFIYKIAKKIGFNVPIQYDISGITINNINDLSFPLIYKPKQSVNYSKADFEIFYFQEDLLNFLQSNKINKDFLLEEYIEGDSNNMYEVFGIRNRYINISPCIIKKIRQFPLNIGSSSFIKTKFNNHLKELSEKLLDKLNYNGLTDIEFKYCQKRKVYYFIELNARPGAPIIVSKKAGVNLVQLWIDNDSKDNLKDLCCKDEVYWLNDSADYKNIKNDNITKYKFLKDVLISNCYAYFNFYDLKPFFKLLLHKYLK